MKACKRLLISILSLAIMLNVLVLPAAKVNAYTVYIASLTVEDFYRTWASASTNSYGTVGVSLSITVWNSVDKKYYGNATGASGYASVGVGLNAGTNNIITYAESTHKDPDVKIKITWDPFSGYWPIYLT